MALECVYSEDQGRSKRQENNQSCRTVSNKQCQGSKIESLTAYIQTGDPA